MGGGMGGPEGVGAGNSFTLPSWYGPGASTGGAPNTSTWPDWAKEQWGKMSLADQGKWQSAVAGQGTTPGGATITQPAPVENLGFPAPDLTANPTPTHAPVAAPAAATGEGFTHTPYPATDHAALTDHAAASDPVVTPATPTTPEAPKESPMDWLFPGYLPTDFHQRTNPTFGGLWDYSATGPSYTSGYGSVGNFGGVKGRGPVQEGLKDQVLMPQMEAGKKLEGAAIDQYDRVRREDYDRYMKLYGVGYDLPAYQQALNGLVYQTNMQNYTPGGGG
jgi:hypothetical protein